MSFLPSSNLNTSLSVDAMHVIRKWSFQRDETFCAGAERYIDSLPKALPKGTTSVHFCCDRYETSLKSQIYNTRYPSSAFHRQYEVKEQYKTPDPESFFSNAQNKANLQKYLCEYWSRPGQTSSPLGRIKLYLRDGFRHYEDNLM